MTPDLTARIEAAAKSFSDKIEAMPSHDGLSEIACKRLVLAALKECMFTLAEQIIAEKDAEAAALREVFGELLRYLHAVSDDRAVGFSAPMPVDVLENAEATLDSSTTGRETLAELERLRNMEQVLQQHFDTFTGEEQPPDRHNIAYSAIRVLVARATELVSLRKQVRELKKHNASTI